MRQLEFGLLIVLCLGVASCSAQAPTTAPMPIQTSTPAGAHPKSGKIRYFHNPNVDMRDVPTLMALDDLRSQGYTVEDAALQGSALLIGALERGDADLISGNNENTWTAITKGIKARTIMQRIGMPLIVASKQELNTCADLDGRPLGLSTSTGLVTSLFNLYMSQNCPKAKPQTLSISDDDGRVAGLLSGQLDAAQLPTQYLLNLERQAPGRFHTLIPVTDSFPKVQINGLHVRSDWAAQNPEAVKDVIRALLQAHRRVIANPQLLYDEAVNRMQLDPVAAKQVGDIYLKANVWDPNGSMTTENAKYTIDFLTSIKSLPVGMKVENVADLSYLNAVLDEIGRK